MKIEEKINNSLNEIDFVLNQSVTVYFVNLIDNKILINNNGLPNLMLLKKEIKDDIVKNKLEYLLGTSITNLKSVYTVEGNGRYYTFDFVDKNILSSYYYQNIYEIIDTEFLKLLKKILN